MLPKNAINESVKLCQIELLQGILHDRIFDGTEHKFNIFGI